MASPLSDLDRVEQVLAASPCGLFTDLDGTISEIAPTPEEARVSPVCRERLREIAARLPLVAVISGRSAQEARQMVDVPGIVYVGNHGLEYLFDDTLTVREDALEYVGRIAAVLERAKRLLKVEGILLENKGVSASLHYRLSPDPDQAKIAILSLLRRLSEARGLRVTEGRMVVELRPPMAVHKGTSVKHLIASHKLRGAIYIGDDTTDLDAFRTLREFSRGAAFHNLTVAIASPEAPPELVAEADYALSSVVEMECFLSWLADYLARPGS